MLPIKLCWAWTIWKAQGQTIRGKVVVSLTSSEKEHGLMYVALSHVTKFSNIGIKDGIDKNRLCTKIRRQAKMTPRIRAESRFHQLEDGTLRFLRIPSFNNLI